jgi:hypothetical protein
MRMSLQPSTTRAGSRSTRYRKPRIRLRLSSWMLLTWCSTQPFPTTFTSSSRSTGVFDLDAGPVTITLPDAGKRFRSMQVINEDQYTQAVNYDSGSYTLSRDELFALRD